MTRLQFANDAAEAAAAEVAGFRAAIDRVAGHLDVVADPARRADTASRLDAEREVAAPGSGIAGRRSTLGAATGSPTSPPTSSRTWRPATSSTSRTC